ncbi:hypothetical protein tpqmel_0932 [Candidatus Gastranaerophilus sp. (ex Termes propinquus)]|nr:hypothetical protein tpqmel_0932 [Candidatus Gastranaerophilus sp. (ex Termes propinquus)]
MEFDKLKMIEGKKKFFLTSFLTSFIFYLLSAALVLPFRETFASMAETVWGLDSEQWTLAFVLLMGLWKILIIQFTLVPFIALFAAEKYLKSKEPIEQ